MNAKLLLLTLFSLLAGYYVTHAAENCKQKQSSFSKQTGVEGAVSTAEKKQPVEKVNVTAYLLSKKTMTVLTDENGNYAFAELKPGTYKFVFEKSGFKKVIKEKIIVKTEGSFQMDIEMVEAIDFEMVPAPTHFSDF